MEKPELSYSISMSRKIGLPNYSNADVFECLSGLTKDTTQEEIDALMSGPGALAYTAIRKALAIKCAKIEDAEWEALKRG